MQNIKSQLCRIVRSQVDVVQRIQALINDKKVADPQGLAKTTLLYALEQRHDFEGVLRAIEKYKCWEWARGFAKRMQGRINSNDRLNKEVLLNPELLLGTIDKMVKKYMNKNDQDDLRQGRIQTGIQSNQVVCLESKVVRRAPKFAFKVEEIQDQPTKSNCDKFVPIDPPDLNRYMENRADRTNYLQERNNQKYQTVPLPSSNQREPLSANRINSRNRRAKKIQKFRSILDEVESFADHVADKSVQKPKTTHLKVEQPQKSPHVLIIPKHDLSFSYSPNVRKEVRLSSNKKVIDRIEQEIKSSEKIVKEVMNQDDVVIPKSNELLTKKQRSELDRTFKQCPCYISLFGFSNMMKTVRGDILTKFIDSLQ